MSGLEPLVALGLACNILQVVGYAKQTITICRTIFELVTANPALDARVRDLTKICEELQARRRSAIGPSTLEDQELLDIAQRTINSAAELKKEVDTLCGGSSSKGKFLSAVSGTLKTAWHKRKLEKLEKSMLDGQRVIEARLLMRLCNQNDALALQQHENFSTLGDTLQNFILAYSQGETRVEHLLQRGFTSLETQIGSDGAKTRQEIVAQVTNEGALTRQEISTRMEELKISKTEQSDQVVEKFLASLRYSTMNERRNQVSDSYEKTFDWVFSLRPEPEERSDAGINETKAQPYSGFIAWLRSADEHLFWISGKPGSGKSTLVKFLIEDEQTREHLRRISPDILLVSHFIWTAGDPMQRSLKGLLCSLLHQLITNHPRSSDILFEIPHFSTLRLKEAPSDWSNKELDVAIFWLLNHVIGSVCIFIDGLDEIDIKDGPVALLDFAGRLSSLPSVNLCISSRPEPVFKKRLSIIPMLKVQDLTQQDILTYARDRLRCFVDAECELDSGDIDSLAERVAERADGVFLGVPGTEKHAERDSKR